MADTFSKSMRSYVMSRVKTKNNALEMIVRKGLHRRGFRYTLHNRSGIPFEDILQPLGFPLPYVTDGGNLTLEFTIQAADVVGAAQVFSSSFAFGTYMIQ